MNRSSHFKSKPNSNLYIKKRRTFSADFILVVIPQAKEIHHSTHFYIKCLCSQQNGITSPIHCLSGETQFLFDFEGCVFRFQVCKWLCLGGREKESVWVFMLLSERVCVCESFFVCLRESISCVCVRESVFVKGKKRHWMSEYV